MPQTLLHLRQRKHVTESARRTARKRTCLTLQGCSARRLGYKTWVLFASLPVVRAGVQAVLAIDLGLVPGTAGLDVAVFGNTPDDLACLPYSSTCLRMGTTVAPEATTAVELVLDEMTFPPPPRPPSLCRGLESSPASDADAGLRQPWLPRPRLQLSLY